MRQPQQVRLQPGDKCGQCDGRATLCPPHGAKHVFIRDGAPPSRKWIPGKGINFWSFTCNFTFPRESLVPALARLPSRGRHCVSWPGLRSPWLCASLLWASLSNS